MLVAFAAAAVTGSMALGVPKATHYVSTAGTDAGNCTASPCRTIGYAVGQATRAIPSRWPRGRTPSRSLWRSSSRCSEMRASGLPSNKFDAVAVPVVTHW